MLLNSLANQVLSLSSSERVLKPWVHSFLMSLHEIQVAYKYYNPTGKIKRKWVAVCLRICAAVI